MNARDLITEARAHGVDLWADGEALGYRGDPESITALLPQIKAHKPELVRLLTGSTPTTAPAPANDPPDSFSWYSVKATSPLTAPAPANDPPDPTEPVPSLPPPWDAIRDRIQAGWRAEFAAPGPDGQQAITWIPPGKRNASEPHQDNPAPLAYPEPEIPPTTSRAQQWAMPTARPSAECGMVTCGACRNWTAPPGDGAGKCGQGVKPTMADGPLCRSVTRYCLKFKPMINASTRKAGGRA